MSETPTHVHRRGGLYTLLGYGRMQTATWIDPIPPHGLGHPRVDMAEVAVYRSADGELWVRPRAEFEDGRFSPYVPEQQPEAASQEAHICPRRAEVGHIASSAGESDTWRAEPEGRRSCSFCGSLHPNDFMAAAEAGVRLTPTDKNYKVYVDVPVAGVGKMYLQHLSVEQRRRFVELMNQRKLTLAEPGYFYVLPFFCRRVKAT